MVVAGIVRVGREGGGKGLYHCMGMGIGWYGRARRVSYKLGWDMFWACIGGRFGVLRDGENGKISRQEMVWCVCTKLEADVAHKIAYLILMRYPLLFRSSC